MMTCIISVLVALPVIIFNSIVVHSQFEHQQPDSFDSILTHFRSITAANCASRPRHELFMSNDTVSQIPNIKELYINPLHLNRTGLAFIHNLALNRAFFFSYLFRKVEDPDEPGLMYYYLSHLADVAASSVVNSSAIYFDTNSSYPNWYRAYFNRTFPLFAPRAVRGDDFNDPINSRRYSTLLMTDVRDLGAVTKSVSNYTHPLFRVNDWFTSWLPDTSTSDHQKITYTVNLKYGNGTEQTIHFFGPPEPQAAKGPVQWTAPYFDCGRTNKWLVAAVSPVLDLYPRHTSWRHLQRHKYVAVVVMETDFLKIDINQCPVSLGNPQPNLFAGTDRCRTKTTECEPLLGYGLRRGGYQCRCRPGYRLPYWQKGPFQGELIERAVEAEYVNKFNCEKIGNIRVVTQHAEPGDAYIRMHGGYVGPQGGQRPSSYLFGLDLHTAPDGYRYPEYPKTSNQSQFYTFDGRPLGPNGGPIVYGPDGMPIITQSGQAPQQIPFLPTWRDFNSHVYHGIMAYTYEVSPNHNKSRVERVLRDLSNVKCNQPISSTGQCFREQDQHRSPRTRRSTFTNSVLLGTLRVMRFINSENCKRIAPEFLVLHGDVAFGKERQFNIQAQVALRLAHFLSAFNQLVDPTERFFERLPDQPLNEEQLFAEVLSNVMGDMRILSSGIFYENSKFPGKVYFAPTAQRTSRNALTFYAEDQVLLMDNKYLSYLNQQWFKMPRERWKASPASKLTKFATRMRIRGDRQGAYSTKYDRFPEQYFAPQLTDGYWSPPYYNCRGHIKEWVLTYSVPFFGIDSIRDQVEFQGIVTVTVPLPELDLNQCSAALSVPNAFKNSHRCDQRSTYCVPILGRRFEIGGYKCECKPGYEYPYNDPVNYFDGQVMESEWEKRLMGRPNKFNALKCRLVGSASLSHGNLVVLLTLSFFLHVSI